MKFKIIHVWVLTSTLWLFMDVLAGIILWLATIVIISQDKQLDILKDANCVEKEQ